MFYVIDFSRNHDGYASVNVNAIVGTLHFYGNHFSTFRDRREIQGNLRMLSPVERRNVFLIRGVSPGRGVFHELFKVEQFITVI